VEMPPAKRKHNQGSETLYDRLKAAVAELRGRGKGLQLGRVHHEMGYRLGRRSWFQPDLSIAHPGQPGDDYYEGAPVLAGERVADGNRPAWIDRKRAGYFANGAVEVGGWWPARRELVIHRK